MRRHPTGGETFCAVALLAGWISGSPGVTAVLFGFGMLTLLFDSTRGAGDGHPDDH